MSGLAGQRGCRGLRFASLGSGSRGNALVVEALPDRGNEQPPTRVLLDCGFGPRELAARLARRGLAPEDLDAILVTHEHSDHSAGVFKCARRHDLEVILTRGTLAALPRDRAASGPPRLRLIDSHETFVIGNLTVQPFPVPHDAREPVQFVFSAGERRLGVLTDAGSITPHIVEMLGACEALFLECNHDVEMLAAGSYPRMLKQRILGRFGHLDNRSAATLLSRLDRSCLRHVVAAHLSEQNNTPQRARSALEAVLELAPVRIGVASQEDGSEWCEIAG